MASGVFTIFCCLICMAIFLISVVSFIITQSFKSEDSFSLSEEESLGHPYNSISVIIETMTRPSKKGSVSGFPSCTLIRKLVSATKLNPFISCFFLISNAVQTSFEFSKVFPQGFSLILFGKTDKRFFNFFLGNGFFYLNNHNPNIMQIR